MYCLSSHNCEVHPSNSKIRIDTYFLLNRVEMIPFGSLLSVFQTLSLICLSLNFRADSRILYWSQVIRLALVDNLFTCSFMIENWNVFSLLNLLNYQVVPQLGNSFWFLVFDLIKQELLVILVLCLLYFSYIIMLLSLNKTNSSILKA